METEVCPYRQLHRSSMSPPCVGSVGVVRATPPAVASCRFTSNAPTWLSLWAARRGADTSASAAARSSGAGLNLMVMRRVAGGLGRTRWGGLPETFAEAESYRRAGGGAIAGGWGRARRTPPPLPSAGDLLDDLPCGGQVHGDGSGRSEWGMREMEITPSTIPCAGARR